MPRHFVSGLFLRSIVGVCVFGVLGVAEPATSDAPDPQRLREQRRQFQAQELIPARAYAYIINAGEAPRIVWRDLDEARRLGWSEPLRVRWFDADLNEAAAPDHPGRWAAWIESTAPNGLPLRRAITFYCRPPGFFLYLPQELRIDLPQRTAPVEAEVWAEHRQELSRLAADLLVRQFNDSEAGAIVLCGLSEDVPRGRPARSHEAAAARNEQFHLDLKLRMQGVEPRPLDPPRRLGSGDAAPVLREGSAAEAGVRDDAKRRIDAVCHAWAEDSGEPFVTLIARRGVIVTHEAFGVDPDGRAIGRDYRADVASITKTITAILFSRFLEQGRVKLDDRVSAAFADYPKDDPRVPTFRQCLTHTSGLRGHGEFGGVRNPHFENVILSGIDVNRPGVKYEYTGAGFELVAKAMEMLSGKCAARLYAEDLFEPLGLDDMPLSSASSGASPTAYELAVLAQLLSNRGRYGQIEMFSDETFEAMLPEPLGARYPGIDDVEGLGMHWMFPRRPGAPADSTDPADLHLSRRTIGHGSLSHSVFLVDLERDLIIIQLRRQAGDRHGEWIHKFYQAIVESLDDAPATLPADVER